MNQQVHLRLLFYLVPFSDLIHSDMTIYIANFNFRLQDTDLNRLFSVYGRVESASVIKDKATRKSKGFGFVQMPDDKAGSTAITALHGTIVDGRTLVVNIARNREEVLVALPTPEA